MIVPDAATDVANYIAAAGLGLTLGTNLFVADEIAAGVAPAVYVRPSGGPAPEDYFGDAQSFLRLQVSVLVRGEREKKPESATLARSVASALHQAPIAGYVDVQLRESQPVFLGTDDNDAPGWAIGVECHIKS